MPPESSEPRTELLPCCFRLQSWRWEQPGRMSVRMALVPRPRSAINLGKKRRIEHQDVKDRCNRVFIRSRRYTHEALSALQSRAEVQSLYQETDLLPTLLPGQENITTPFRMLKNKLSGLPLG